MEFVRGRSEANDGQEQKRSDRSDPANMPDSVQMVVETPSSLANDSQLAQLHNLLHNQLRGIGDDSDDEPAGTKFNPIEIDNAMANGMGLQNEDSKFDESLDARRGSEVKKLELNYKDIGTLEQ